MPRNLVLRPYTMARPPTAPEAAPVIRTSPAWRRAASPHAVLGSVDGHRANTASSAQAQDKLTTFRYDGWTPLKCICMAGLFVAAFGVTLIAMVLQ